MDASHTIVKGPSGTLGVVESIGDGSIQLHLEQGGRAVVPADLFEQRGDHLFLPLSATQLATYSASAEARTQEEEVIPVVREELRVGRREVETGKVLVNKVVQQREEVVDEPVITEEAQIERVPINQYVDQMPQVRQEGETMIIPVVEEVLVIEKRLRLKEEVRVSRQRQQRREPQAVTLRSEQIDVQRTKPETASRRA